MAGDESQTVLQEGSPRVAFGAQLGAGAFVVVVSSPELGALRVVGQTPVTIGRGRGCQIRLSDPAVSKEHCRVATRPAGGYAIEDLGSTNGTLMNGRKLAGAAPLRKGDLIQVGQTVLELRK